MFTTRTFLLAPLAAVLFFMLPQHDVRAAEAGTMINLFEQIAPVKAYYDAVDEWPRSHGWKPYKRFEWEIMQRAGEDGIIPAGAYWEGYLAHMRMSRVTLDEPWTPIGPYNHGGRTRVLRFHPNDPTIMFAGSVGGGLFKSTDSGQNWFPITDMLPNIAVGSFEIHPLYPDTMYLGTGEGYFNSDGIWGVGLLKSVDGGQTWQTTGLAYPYSQQEAILCIDIDPRVPNIVFASNNNGLYRSTDGGTTFTVVRTGNINALERDPQNPDVMLCASGSSFGNGGVMFRSTDNGLTWSTVTTGLPQNNAFGRAVISFHAGNSQVVYAGVSGTSSYNGYQMVGVYRSTNNGVNWIHMSPDDENHYAGQGWYDMAVAVSPVDPAVVLSSGLDLYRSTNSGFDWTRETFWYYEFGDPDYVHADHHEIVFHPENPQEVWAVTDGGIFKSINQGQTWTEMNRGYNTFQYYAMGSATLDTILTLGGTQDNGTSRYSGLPDWDEVYGGDGGYCVIDPTDNDTWYVETQNGNRQRTDNAGLSFHSINGGISGNGAWVTPMALDPFDHLVLYTTTTNGGVWQSHNQGRPGTWEELGDVGSTNQVIVASPLVQGLVYVGSQSTVYRYDPLLDEWASVTGNLSVPYVTRLVCDPFNPDGVYATGSGYFNGHIFYSATRGGTWQNISGNLPAVPFQDLIVDPTEPATLYAGGDLGVYRTTNAGQSWERFGDGLPNVRVDDMELQPVTGKLRIATHGRGMWEIATGSSDLALLFPNGGEVFAVGEEISFRWAGVTHGGEVSFDINRNYPDGEWEEIIPATENNGAAPWVIEGPVSDNCRFRIQHQTIPTQTDTSDFATSIATASVELVYPNGGETVLTGDFGTLQFARTLAPDPLRIELNRDYPDGEWEMLAAGIEADEYSWIVQIPGGDHCRVRITSTERPQLNDMSEADFVIRSPEMAMIAPNGGEQLHAGVPFDIQWSAEEHQGRVRITANTDYPNGSWLVVSPNSLNSGTHSWSPPDVNTSNARVRVSTLLDPFGSYTESAESFSIISLDAEEAAVPAQYHVSEAWPNPFNPSTQFTLQLPARTEVIAVVYNHLGQEIATLADGIFDAGRHRIAWDAAALSSGTYFIHITAFDETIIRKAILLK